MKVVLAVLCLCAVVSALSVEDEFLQFQKKFNKFYDASEYQLRLNVFRVHFQILLIAFCYFYHRTNNLLYNIAIVIIACSATVSNRVSQNNLLIINQKNMAAMAAQSDARFGITQFTGIIMNGK